MNLDAALETFVMEARELLQAMEDALLAAEQGERDADGVHAIFRAAHTIKGSAGLFGLDDIVAFTHVLESVLDGVRAGTLEMDGDLTALLLSACDHVGSLIGAVAAGTEADAQLRAQGEAMKARLAGYAGALPIGAAVSQAARAQDASGVQRHHISVRFGRDVLRDGMDCLAILRYLGTLGKLVQVETVTEALPDAAEMDAQSCYLGFEIAFESRAGLAEIESVFDFVRDDCQLVILPPESSAAQFVDLIRSLPEDDLRLGEILVRCGCLSREALARALGSQGLAADGAAKPLGEILVQAGTVPQDMVDAGLARQARTRERTAPELQTVRVDARKLEQLIDLVGELVIAGSAVGVIGRRAGLADLTEAVSTLSRMVEGVRDHALQLRMVPIGATFSRFKRVVHDVSRELGKEIDLHISGEETELDKTVVEQIADPLTHLVRNAVDHGIEAADLRRARGKPARGVVRLNAYHDSGAIVIEIEDDGGGLDRDRILAKAIERGLVAPDARLADQDVYALIFEPGFSTARAVTNLSGRGVGLDVVKRKVNALRGTVQVSSEAGQGTRFRIHLPLTLAIIDGFLVSLSDGRYVLPLDAVEECIDWDHSAYSRRDYMNLRDEVLPLIRLRELFETDGVPPGRQNVVVVRHAGRRAGLVVDKLLGETQAVIKPLGPVFERLDAISGSTILGDGAVALILDVAALMQRAQRLDRNGGGDVPQRSTGQSGAAQCRQGSPALRSTKLEGVES